MDGNGNLDYPPYQKAMESLDRAIAKVEAGFEKKVIVE
jgi:hypothetical protein